MKDPNVLHFLAERPRCAGYVYVRSEPGLWTVGFYDPAGAWIAESDHDSKDEAAARVSYLNGGHAPPSPPINTGPR